MNERVFSPIVDAKTNPYYKLDGTPLPDGTRLSRSLAGVTQYVDENGVLVDVAYPTPELAESWRGRQADAVRQANMGIQAGPR